MQGALLEWHAREGLRAPWRESRDPYECLVAAVMAQQTQMSRVLSCYERFLAAFPTVESLAAGTPGEVIRVWKGMGYNQRAVRLHRAAQTIVAQGWPRTAKELEGIEGIGPFTAAIVASFAFGEPAACVDTNVVRVLTRLTGDETLRGKRLQDVADAVLPRGRAGALEPGDDGLRRARLWHATEVRRVRRREVVRLAIRLREWGVRSQARITVARGGGAGRVQGAATSVRGDAAVFPGADHRRAA